jgi:hypothetical protein
MTIERPPHIEARKAVCIVDSEYKKSLAIREYILESRIVCSDCRTPRKKRNHRAEELQ